MAKTKLSISLIKEGIAINNVLKPGIPSLTLANGLDLYYKNNQPISPKWLNTFLKGEFVGQDSLLGKSVSAVILYQINVGENTHRIFAVCFGYGKALLETNVVEKRFGLLTTLNCVDADKLRSIDINSMEAIPLNNRIQSSALAEIRNFNIDVDRDLLKSVTGKASGDALSGTISGADSLSVSTDKSYDEIEDFLKHCYHLYKSDHYREAGFDWINQIQEIKDKTLIERLDQQLILEFNSENSARIWTSIPEIIDYYSLESFKLKSDIIYDDLSVSIIKDEYENNISVVVNLAAQAGVRYSITNPDAYIQSNLIGFYNILEACRHHEVEHLVYASSSSVYGSNKKVPYSTDDKVDNPVSLYAATKKSNELMAHAYSKLYNIPSTGLRFFTVYGPAGRPDMAYFGFTNKLVKGETIKIFNYGNCKRDFTYVDDIVEGVVRVMQHAPEKRNGDDGLPIPPYKVYNIGNNSPENLLDFVTILQEELVRAGVLPEDYDFEAHKQLVPMQPGDVPVTYADTTPLEQDFGFKPNTSLREGLRHFAEWYAKYYGKNLK